MKTVKRTFGSLLILSAFIFTNCTKDQQVNYEDTTREIITNGKWKVEYFFSGQDLTASYNNYQFNFLGNGTVSASDGTHEVSGTWKMIRDVNYNDVLQISLNTGDPDLNEMNENWQVTDKSTHRVSMADGSNHQLHISKL